MHACIHAITPSICSHTCMFHAAVCTQPKHQVRLSPYMSYDLPQTEVNGSHTTGLSPASMIWDNWPTALTQTQPVQTHSPVTCQSILGHSTESVWHSVIFVTNMPCKLHSWLALNVAIAVCLRLSSYLTQPVCSCYTLQCKYVAEWKAHWMGVKPAMVTFITPVTIHWSDQPIYL